MQAFLRYRQEKVEKGYYLRKKYKIFGINLLQNGQTDAIMSVDSIDIQERGARPSLLC